MLLGKVLRAKRFFTTVSGESAVDLISSTFKFGENSLTIGHTVTSEYEQMRPDVLAERVTSSQENWEAILKFNGISNPFSLDAGEFLLIPAYQDIPKLVTPPREVVEKGTEPAKKNEEAVVKPKSKKDKMRLESLRTNTSEVVPPNINLTGSQNVKVVDGKIVFGGDMTQTSATSANQSVARNRIQNQLTNNTGL